MCLPLLAARYPLHNMKVTEAAWNMNNMDIGNALSAAGYKASQAVPARKAVSKNPVVGRPFLVSQESHTTLLDGVFLSSLSLLFVTLCRACRAYACRVDNCFHSVLSSTAANF